MADLPRLNNIIRALEAGHHALTCFAPAHVDSAIAMSASKFDACVFEMEHNPWDSGRLRDCLQYMLNRAQIAKAGTRAAGDAAGPHPGQRRRDGAVAGQAGARLGLLRHRVPAHLDRRGGRQRGRRLPLSAAQERGELRSGRHPRRRSDGGGALLGRQPAGILPEGRRLAAQSAGRDFLHPADRGYPRRREPGCHADQGEGHRRDPDRRGRPRRRSSAIRGSTSTPNCSNG